MMASSSATTPVFASSKLRRASERRHEQCRLRHLDHRSQDDPGRRLFQNGASSSVHYADFDQSYDAINGLTYQQSPSVHTVQNGEALKSTECGNFAGIKRTYF